MKYKAKTEARNTQNRAVRTSVMICFTVLITLSAGEQIKTMPKMSSGEEAFSLSMGKAETKYSESKIPPKVLQWVSPGKEVYFYKDSG